MCRLCCTDLTIPSQHCRQLLPHVQVFAPDSRVPCGWYVLGYEAVLTWADMAEGSGDRRCCCSSAVMECALKTAPAMRSAHEVMAPAYALRTWQAQ